MLLVVLNKKNETEEHEGKNEVNVYDDPAFKKTFEST